MKNNEKIVGFLLFVFVFALYAFSISKTIAFWDSSEFVTTNFHLQSTHPPGAPFYTLLCNFILLFFPASWAALISNLISAFFGALTIVLVYRIINFLILKINGNLKVALVSAIVGALSLAFSNTFWTAATETEVYTLSMFLLMLLFYIMLLWHTSNESGSSNRLLLVFSLVLGISVGVHLINLSVIIPFAVLYMQKKKGLDWKKILLALILGTFSFLALYIIGIQGFLKLAFILDISLVNNFQWPVNSGLFVLIVLFFGISLLGMFIAKKRESMLANYILGILLFALGSSSYLLPIFRNNVNSSFSNQIVTSNDLLRYIQAKQFGVDNIPLVKGKVFNAPLDKDFPFLNGEAIYSYNSESKQYELVDSGKFSKVNYAHEFDMFFPRMYSQKPSSAQQYANWVAIKGEKIQYPVMGKDREMIRPTFSENIQFFINYQVKWLYLRYLYWNFIGKQNDTKGTGAIFNGNWQSGINYFDKDRIGDSSVFPSNYQEDKSNDVYYFLPFLLGIIGLWSLRKNKSYLITSIVLFLTFGIGITIYVNPLPESILIRERDYIFLGSFIVFSIWIGLAVVTLYDWFQKITSEKIRIGVVTIVVVLASPMQLLAKNWDNHQRTSDVFAYDLAKMYLNSCPKNAVLITNGDNFTFPLWYLQEVEKFRDDVRVINYDQLNIATYIDKLQQTTFSASPLRMTFAKKYYREGNPKLFPLQKDTEQPLDAFMLFEFLNNDKTTINWNGKMQHYVPGDLFSISVDTTKAAFTNIDLNKIQSQLVSKIVWKNTKDFYQLNDLILLNLIQENINNKPICFLVNGNREHYLGLQDHLVHRGFVEQLLPVKRVSEQLNPKIVASEVSEKIILDNSLFNNLNHSDEFIRSENVEYIQTIVRRNYYFLAQALIENGKKEEAKRVLERCFVLFPNKTVAFRQYAFALGKLYYKIGEAKKGNEICMQCIQNIKNELVWITSFNPQTNPILNVKKAAKLKEIYEQMIVQFEVYNPQQAQLEKKEAIAFANEFNKWQIKNWPY